MYTYHFELNDDDYFEFNLVHQFSIPQNRKYALIYKWIFPFIVFAFQFVALLRGSTTIYGWIFCAVASLLWLAFSHRLIVFILRRQIGSVRKSGKIPYDKDTTLQFTADSIIETGTDVEKTIKYAVVEKIIIGQNAFYLYENAIGALIIPFRIFASAQDKDAFLQFITEKTNAPQILGKVR